jgi:hypothetical protein
MRPKLGTPEDVRKHYRERDKLIRSLGFPSYKAYLSSMFWRALRAEHLRINESCVVCESPAEQVHHMSYTKAALDGTDPKQLASVCAGHHRAIEFDGFGRKRSPRQAAKRLGQLIAEQR